MRAMLVRLALFSCALVSCALVVGLGAATPAAAQQTWVVNVVGLGGAPEYTERFTDWARRIETALVDRWAVDPERITTLGEDAALEGVDGESRRETIEATLARIGAEAGPADRVLLVLIGHGTFRNDQAALNLPGRDPSASDWNAMLAPLGDRPVGIVNVASSSGPFVEALSAPGRVIVTATRSGRERNETQFGEFFAEALEGDAADLDKDGALSLLEAFVFARSETARYYAEEGLLATEHAQIDDDGDGEATDLPTADTTDGPLAATFRFGGRASGAAASDDPAVAALEAERAEIEARVVLLRQRRGEMGAEEYDAALEALLVELALKNREIAAARGGGA
jgi:hypothetical protein